MKPLVINNNFRSNEKERKIFSMFRWIMMCLVLCSVSEEGPADKGEKRYQEIVQRRKLEDLAKAQAEDLALLMREVERLRRRNFPSLDQLKHK